MSSYSQNTCGQVAVMRLAVMQLAVLAVLCCMGTLVAAQNQNQDQNQNRNRNEDQPAPTWEL